MTNSKIENTTRHFPKAKELKRSLVLGKEKTKFVTEQCPNSEQIITLKNIEEQKKINQGIR